ncbi:MAG: NusG domain II-containing protein [Candidatus Aminicenantes bacterium]|nr:NusG domain II-containing protein [Candidatus Aminicenantes bacterium]
MDRRLFLKTVLSSSLALPLTAALGPEAPSGEKALYLITDFPQDILPGLLASIDRLAGDAGRSIALAHSHPLAEKVGSALKAQGWNPAPPGDNADIVLSFASLDRPCAPSFAFIQNGRVVDLRRRRLMTLWEEMSRSGLRSSVLTVAALRPRRPISAGGSRAAIYLDGKKQGAISLVQDAVRTFESAGGFVTVRVADGRAKVWDSSCRQKICLCSSAVSAAGERIICAPNRFTLQVEGQGRVDTVIG